ncbi:androgen-induced gene 1 protein isoform X4 [Megalobrama amblycephala]|uniref:androgen-induced gene 1 protein isoform X4 n=1 Tax=Megalobrama amblycephala TaxID=75352 RepID=UPI002013E7C5|nr:androgen-induced gene 1 protein isoform X4 [Megalobrama amblycephala]
MLVPIATTSRAHPPPPPTSRTDPRDPLLLSSSPPHNSIPLSTGYFLRRKYDGGRKMALIPSQILRVAILLSYFSILCNYKAIDMPAHQTYGGSWKFLTFIDLVIQAVFFGVCVLTDLSSLLTKGSASMEQERQLRKLIGLRDWMMAVLAFPVGVLDLHPEIMGSATGSVRIC